MAPHPPAKAPSVFDYLDFRGFLRDYYLYKKDRQRGFSYRAFARRAGFASPNFLKLVVDGQRNLSEEMAQRFATACGLAKDEQRYFLNLVKFGQAARGEDKQALYEKLAAHRSHRGVAPLEGARLAYFSQWYLPAIRELARRADFRADPEWVGAMLWPEVAPKEVAAALEKLQDLKLLQVGSDGTATQGDAPLLSTSPETQSVLVGGYHRAMMQRAAEAIDLIPAEQRDLSALVMCLGPEGLRRLKERVQRFRRELLELSCLEENPRQVVQLNFQLFPLSRDAAQGDGKGPESRLKGGPPAREQAAGAESAPEQSGPAPSGPEQSALERSALEQLGPVFAPQGLNGQGRPARKRLPSRQAKRGEGLDGESREMGK